MKSEIPSSFNKLLSTIGKLEEFLAKKRLRGLLVIAGSTSQRLGLLAGRSILYHERIRHRYDKKKKYAGLYVYHDEFQEAESMKTVFKDVIEEARYTEFEFDVYEKSEKYLGKTYSYLVLDLTRDVKPNDVGKLAGIVEGGGLIIFLAPNWESWDHYLTIFKQNLTVPQYPEPRHVFITWFKNKLLEHDGVAVYDADNNLVIKKFSLEKEKYTNVESREVSPPEKTLFPEELYRLALTGDQVRVVNLMEWFYEKPKGRKVLVVTADRGRGKSCAVAIGSVGLIHLLSKVKPKPRVLVTAPSPGSVQSFFTMASTALDTLGYKYDVVKKGGDIIELRGGKFSIEYWEPLSIPNIKGDLVVVDEASGIHVPMLYKIWEAHKRTVYATTIHGYEGAGRGFSVRFLRRVKSDESTEVLEYEMTEPIRYGRNDPVEEWSFKTLLLDAEPAELDERDLRDIEEKNLVYVSYDPSYLFSREGESELRELFGIYVLAHYRNEPDDLGMLADAPHHLIRAVKTGSGKIVSAIQIAEEGPIQGEMVDELLKGGRIPGNIIPDRFLKHTRLREFGELKGWRIVRIATHPSVQGRGIGSWGLRKLIEEASLRGLDWVASGFGVNEELLRFWVKNDFKVVHISPDRNPVSGEYTVLVVHPLNERTQRFVSISEREFKAKLLLSLPVNYRDMELEVAKLLIDSTPPILNEFDRNILTPIQLDRLWVYCLGPMTFEAAADLMFKLAGVYFSLPSESRPKLNRLEELVLLAKTLQGRSWEELEELLKKPAKELHKAAHDVACKMFEYITGVKPENYKPGVKLGDYTSSRLLFL